jgi:Helix-turn-helix domain
MSEIVRASRRDLIPNGEPMPSDHQFAASEKPQGGRFRRISEIPAQRTRRPASGRPKSREKVFGVGRPRPLDRNAKTRVMYLARCLMRRTEKGKHYGVVTAKAFSVLQALLWTFHNAKSGLCYPSYDRIAEAAGCARSTIAEAIKALEDAGILSWVQRIKRVRESCPDLLGDEGWRWRVLRTSNSYAFTDPSPAAERPQPSKSENQPETQNQAFIPLLVRAAIASNGLEASLSRLSTGVQSRNGA